MRDLDARSAVTAGGWDPRFAVTVAVATGDAIAAALIDTNGDGAGIDLDEYVRDADGAWQAATSGSADDGGVSWSTFMVAVWGRADSGQTVRIDYLGARHSTRATDAGWWLFIAPPSEDSEAVPQRVQR